MDFYSAYDQGSPGSPPARVPVAIADPAANARAVLEQARACHDDGVAVAVFPELSLSGYSIDDLLLQDTLLDAVERRDRGRRRRLAPTCCLCSWSARRSCTAPASSTARWSIHRGRVLGVAPKSYLPTYREFYERRWFAPGDDRRGSTIRLAGERGALRARPDLRGDRRAGADAARRDLRGHVGAGPAERRGRPRRRHGARQPVRQPDHGRPRRGPPAARPRRQRALLRGVRSSPPPARGSPRPTCRWDGQTMVYECGDLLGETERFPDGPRRTVVDVDLDRIRQERIRQGTFDDNRRTLGEPDRRRSARSRSSCSAPTGDIGLRRKVDRFPFVPDDVERLALDCYEAYNIQVSGLEQRLHAIGQPKVVIGVSGGLDSTHALIVAAKAMDRLGRDRSDIHAFTMPGFATGDTTKSYATRLSKSLGVTFEEIDITAAANQLLADLGHPFADGEEVYDVTFENVQAGLRTDYLFRLANHRGGIVLGTGDLSELALGWCTYGVGDQMSHYNVNAGVPKTLIQHLIRWVSDNGQFEDETNELLREIVEQEITPELIPTREDHLPQSTDGSVGPYSLQDFTLFHVHPPRPPAEQDRVPRLARVARRGPRGVAARVPAGAADGLRPAGDPVLAGRVHETVLREPVQALRVAQRAQGQRRRHHVTAR